MNRAGYVSEGARSFRAAPNAATEGHGSLLSAASSTGIGAQGGAPACAAARHVRSGFTLIEVMIASAIFGIVALAFGSALIGTMKLHRTASRHYAALSIARNRIQRAYSMPYETLTQENFGQDWKPVDERGEEKPNGLYQRLTIVSTNYSGCVKVTVSVRFPMVMGRGMNPNPLVVETLCTPLTQPQTGL